MTYDEFLMQALVSQGVLEEFRFIREATPVIVVVPNRYSRL